MVRPSRNPERSSSSPSLTVFCGNYLQNTTCFVLNIYGTIWSLLLMYRKANIQYRHRKTINISASGWHTIEILVSWHTIEIIVFSYMFLRSRNTTVSFRKAKCHLDGGNIGFLIWLPYKNIFLSISQLLGDTRSKLGSISKCFEVKECKCTI